MNAMYDFSLSTMQGQFNINYSKYRQKSHAKANVLKIDQNNSSGD